MARFEEAADDTTQLAALEIAAKRGGLAAANHRGGQIVHFYKRLVEDEAATAEHGRPKFKEVDFVKIVTPGSMDYIDRPVNIDRTPRSDDKRFPEEWKRFQQNGESVQEGTPLAAVPSLSRSQVEELKYLHCVTVEQLAQLDDSACQKFMGVQKLRQWAKDYLEAAESAAPVTRLSRENEQLKNDLDTQRRQLEELKALVYNLQKVKASGALDLEVPLADDKPAPRPAPVEDAVPVAPRKLKRAETTTQ